MNKKLYISIIIAFLLGAFIVYPTNFEKPIVELGEDYPVGYVFEVPSIAWSNGYKLCLRTVTSLPNWTNWSSRWCKIFPVYLAKSQNN
jgi:hypothetical protein